MDAVNVMPNDQHLKTADGVELNDNGATLADLSIFPDMLLLAKVSKIIYCHKLLLEILFEVLFKSNKN